MLIAIDQHPTAQIELGEMVTVTTVTARQCREGHSREYPQPNWWTHEALPKI